MAAANGCNIHIYNPYSLELITVLSGGHPGAALIKSLRFVKEDAMLVSSCTYGVTNMWNIKNGNRVMEHPFKL